MVRSARLIAPGHPHHLIQRGIDGRQIFQDDADYQVFLDWLCKAARQFKVALHAYVLMPDHLHVLATPSDEVGLARMMQWVGRYYVPYFNRKYERAGTLWQGRYRTTVIDSENYLLVCMRYIELNPVRAHLVADPVRYRWSSHAHHIGTASNPLITDHELYWALGNTPFEREAAYQALFESALSANQLAELAETRMNGRALGSDQFKQRLERQTDRPVLVRRPGRPAKNSGSE